MWRMNPNRKCGFTLAELLVVIVIIGIMFAIALPMLSNISGQTKLESAANAVHAAAKMARQHAVANNQPAYLVFNTGQDDPQLAYRAYRVFTIDIHTQPITQSNGKFLTNWAILPAGITFDPFAEQDANAFIPGNRSWGGGLNNVGLLKIGSQTYSVVGFSPRGKISNYEYDERKIILAAAFLTSDALTRTSENSKTIEISANGKSMISDTHYNEADSDAQLLGEIKK